jgi:hypothetical protein
MENTRNMITVDDTAAARALSVHVGLGSRIVSTLSGTPKQITQYHVIALMKVEPNSFWSQEESDYYNLRVQYWSEDTATTDEAN